MAALAQFVHGGPVAGHINGAARHFQRLAVGAECAGLKLNAQPAPAAIAVEQAAVPVAGPVAVGRQQHRNIAFLQLGQRGRVHEVEAKRRPHLNQFGLQVPQHGVAMLAAVQQPSVLYVVAEQQERYFRGEARLKRRAGPGGHRRGGARQRLPAGGGGHALQRRHRCPTRQTGKGRAAHKT